jgi:integrase
MRCNVAVDADSRALPVIGTGGLAAVRKSARSRWRAAVLIAVHVLVAAHIAHYVMAGRTLSPVEPSESEAWKRHRAKIRNLGPVKAGLQGVRRYGGGMKPDSEATAAYRERLRAAVPFFKTMLYTGSRPSEVLRLVWRDVDLERGVVAVWQEKTGARKTDHVSKAFREVLSGLRRGVGTVPLFVRPDGSSLTKDDVERTFDLAKRIPRLRAELTLYSIRHTFASWLAIQGTPIRTIQELGHRDLRNDAALRPPVAGTFGRLWKRSGAVEDSNRLRAGCASEEKAETGNEAKSLEQSWWPQRDSNPCRGLERAVS